MSERDESVPASVDETYTLLRRLVPHVGEDVAGLVLTIVRTDGSSSTSFVGRGDYPAVRAVLEKMRDAIIMTCPDAACVKSGFPEGEVH